MDRDEAKVVLTIMVSAIVLVIGAMFYSLKTYDAELAEPEKVYACIGFQEGEKLLARERHVFGKEPVLRGRSKDGAGNWHDVAIPKSGLKGCLHVPGVEMQ